MAPHPPDPTAYPGWLQLPRPPAGGLPPPTPRTLFMGAPPPDPPQKHPAQSLETPNETFGPEAGPGPAGGGNRQRQGPNWSGIAKLLPKRWGAASSTVLDGFLNLFARFVLPVSGFGRTM